MSAEKYTPDFLRFFEALKVDPVLKMSWFDMDGLFLLDGEPLNIESARVMIGRLESGKLKFGAERTRKQNALAGELKAQGKTNAEAAQQAGIVSGQALAMRRYRENKRREAENAQSSSD